MTENKEKDLPFTFKVLNITENQDGSADVNLDVSDEFMEWFKKKEGLKRWSHKRFQKFFIETLEAAIVRGREDEQI